MALTLPLRRSQSPPSLASHALDSIALPQLLFQTTLQTISFRLVSLNPNLRWGENDNEPWSHQVLEAMGDPNPRRCGTAGLGVRMIAVVLGFSAVVGLRTMNHLNREGGMPPSFSQAKVTRAQAAAPSQRVFLRRRRT